MFVDAKGARLHTVALGAGPRTVACINGWSADWELWLPLFEALSPRSRCVAYDTRGTGVSTTTPEAVTFEALVDDLFAVLDARDVARCVLVGESLGGLLALHAAAAHPERFEALVVCGAPPVLPRAAIRERAAAARADYAAAVRAFVRLCLNEPDAQSLVPWGEQMFLRGDGEIAARLLEVSADRPAPLDRVRVPTLVVHGALDAVTPRAASEMVARGVPGARLSVIEGAGHVPVTTRPLEVAAEIERFLSALR